MIVPTRLSRHSIVKQILTGGSGRKVARDLANSHAHVSSTHVQLVRASSDSFTVFRRLVKSRTRMLPRVRAYSTTLVSGIDDFVCPKMKDSTS